MPGRQGFFISRLYGDFYLALFKPSQKIIIPAFFKILLSSQKKNLNEHFIYYPRFYIPRRRRRVPRTVICGHFFQIKSLQDGHWTHCGLLCHFGP